MPELPNEIWSKIASYLPENDLRKLYSVNRFFFELAMSLRYKEIRAYYLDGYLIRKLERLQDPFVAGLVSSLSIQFSAIHQLEEHSDRTRKERRSFRARYKTIKFAILRLFAKRQRNNGTNLSWMTDLPSQEVARILNGAIANMKNVQQFRVNWSNWYLPNEIPSFVYQAWSMFGANLRKLELDLLTKRIPLLLAAVPNFDNLAELGLFIYQGSDTENDASDHAEGFTKLNAFVHKLAPQLKSFYIFSAFHFDFSPFFVDLGKFAMLQKLGIHIPLDSAHLSDTSALRRILTDYGTAIEDLTLQQTRCYDLTHQFPFHAEWISRILMNISLPSLKSLNIGLDGASDNCAPAFQLLEPYAAHLKKLTVSGTYLTQDELHMLTMSLSHSTERSLQSLCVYVHTLTKQVIDLLASSLPHLRRLFIQVIRVQSSLPDDGGTCVEQLFCREMEGVRYDDWKLFDITLMEQICCGGYELYPIMDALAKSVPSIQSFGGRGNKERTDLYDLI